MVAAVFASLPASAQQTFKGTHFQTHFPSKICLGLQSLVVEVESELSRRDSSALRLNSSGETDSGELTWVNLGGMKEKVVH